MKQQVGIEAITVAVPRRYVDLGDLARARGVDPAKFTHGLGGVEMAVAEPGEDTAALAATAAAQLLRSRRVDPARIGMLVVGTETGVDHSKAVASYVQGMLQLPRTMRTFDCQHACYGGTAALNAVAEWIASGAGAGRVGVVICSDIARYGLNTAGEPTQGAGAVAMLVSESPELLALDLGVSGTFSMDVHDFWRPLGRREAVVDGHYSIQCYLEAVSGSYRAWRARALGRDIIRAGGLPSEQLARIAYHVPFCKMAKKAHAQLRRCDLEDRAGRALDAAAEAEEAPRAAASFEAQVAPSLGLSARVGNVYTGSLYLSLASLLHREAAALAGKRIGLFSYGSGCVSEFFSGVVGPRASETIATAGLDRVLSERQRIGIEEYERILTAPPDRPLGGRPPAGGFCYAGTEEFRRTYVAG
ncbi:MAG TPA: hydroxymethylglutaryl-CoA synthase [Myxococcaceae bacterium]|nr:hydroxymethylglutaryl-CoA synthase [Myxococcaceae bacterium]